MKIDSRFIYCTFGILCRLKSAIRAVLIFLSFLCNTVLKYLGTWLINRTATYYISHFCLVFSSGLLVAVPKVKTNMGDGHFVSQYVDGGTWV